MKDTNDKSESGAVGQPGESTTREAKSFTSAGISSLLNSEFAKDAAETPGQEIPPGEQAETVHHEEGATEEGGEAKVEDGKGEGEGEQAVAVVEDEGGAKLPAEMQTAIEEWEAKGGPLPDALQHVVNKRIGRLTGEKAEATKRAEAAEAALKHVQAEVETLRNDPQRPAAQLASPIPDEQALVKAERTAKQFLNEAEAYLDDAASPEERQRVERFMESNQLDANGLKRHVRQINAFVRDALPGQKQLVQQFKADERKFSEEARTAFAWLKDPNAPEQQARAQMLKLLPDLPKRLPNHEMVLGIYLLGMKAYEAQMTGKQSPAAKTAAKTPPPRTPAGNATAQAAGRSRRSASDNAGEAFSKAPTRDNAVNLARAALMES